MKSKSTQGLICLRRTQDLKSFDDEYCVACWQFITEWPVQKSYLDREECFEENVVTEEEFDGYHYNSGTKGN